MTWCSLRNNLPRGILESGKKKQDIRNQAIHSVQLQSFFFHKSLIYNILISAHSRRQITFESSNARLKSKDILDQSSNKQLSATSLSEILSAAVLPRKIGRKSPSIKLNASKGDSPFSNTQNDTTEELLKSLNNSSKSQKPYRISHLSLKNNTLLSLCKDINDEFGSINDTLKGVNKNQSDFYEKFFNPGAPDSVYYPKNSFDSTSIYLPEAQKKRDKSNRLTRTDSKAHIPTYQPKKTSKKIKYDSPRKFSDSNKYISLNDESNLDSENWMYRYYDRQTVGGSLEQITFLHYAFIDLSMAKILLEDTLSDFSKVSGNKLYRLVHILLQNFGGAGFMRYLKEDGFHLLYDAFFRRARTRSFARIYHKSILLMWLCKSAKEMGYQLNHNETLTLWRFHIKSQKLDYALLIFKMIKDPTFVDKRVLDAAWRRPEMNDARYERRKLFYQMKNLSLWVGLSSSMLSEIFRTENLHFCIQIYQQFRAQWISTSSIIEKYKTQLDYEESISENTFSVINLRKFFIRHHALNAIILACLAKKSFFLAATLYRDLVTNLRAIPNQLTFQYMIFGTFSRTSLNLEVSDSMVMSQTFVSEMSKLIQDTDYLHKMQALLENLGVENSDLNACLGFIIIRHEIQKFYVPIKSEFFLNISHWMELKGKGHLNPVIGAIFEDQILTNNSQVLGDSLVAT